MARNIAIYILCLLSFASSGQSDNCTLNSITFGAHNYIYNTRFDIPVTIDYIGNADSINVSIAGLDYHFRNKIFLTNEQTDTIRHDLTFTVYDTCGSASNWLVSTIQISGVNCPQTNTYIDSFLYVVPGCIEYDQPQEISCLSVLSLSDSVVSGNLYVANDTIHTSQILAKNNYIYEAQNFTLNNGFYSKDGVSFFLDSKSCN